MGEAGAQGGSGEGGQDGTSGAAVEVEDEPRAKLAERSQFRRKRLNWLEDFTEAVFDDDGDPEVGAGALQDLERGSGEDAVAKRPQPDNSDRAFRR